jgi:hypothetical protein
MFPTLQADTPWGMAACDSCYGDLDDDGVSEFSIGRIPVISEPELDAYIAKLIAYESEDAGAWANELLFSADNADIAGEFDLDSDYLASLVEADYPVEKAYIGRHGALDVHNALMAGFGSKGLVNWVGHGNYPSLAHERVLVLDDILGKGVATDPDYKPGMNNGTQLPLFAALTCSAGRFDVPGAVSVSEALVLRVGGGAIAAFSPTGLSINRDAVLLNEGLIRSLYLDGQPRIGDAAVDAQLFYKEFPHWRFMLDIYNVMGDPATILH